MWSSYDTRFSFHIRGVQKTGVSNFEEMKKFDEPLLSTDEPLLSTDEPLLSTTNHFLAENFLAENSR